MLGHSRKHNVPERGMLLLMIAAVLAVVAIYALQQGISLPAIRDGAVADEAAEAAPALVTVDQLRAARPDFTGGYVPDAIGPGRTVEPALSAATLRAIKPDFTGAFVPEATGEHAQEAPPIEILRELKPDFEGGYLPDAATP